MNAASVAAQLRLAWEQFNRQARRDKDSNSAVARLERFYLGLNDAEQIVADEVIIEWALEPDPVKRFDGLALIDRLSIHAAVPALRRLADRIEHEAGPSAVDDLVWVNQILTRLNDPPAKATS